jgi:hypothetical protein
MRSTVLRTLYHITVGLSNGLQEGACSTHWKDGKLINILVGKREWKINLVDAGVN